MEAGVQIKIDINTQQIADNVMAHADELINTRVRSQVYELFRTKGHWGVTEGFMNEAIRKAVDDYATSDVLESKINESISRQIDAAADDAVKMALRHVSRRMVFNELRRDGKRSL